jgi:ornithine cyclodeaminase/alanine dehydrogenase-like protein (mu-crystallin family)
MAIRHLEAICAIRDIQKVKVYSPTNVHRETFASQMSKQLGIDIMPVDEPVKAVRGVDIVCAATSASEPVFDGAWLEPGMHVVCIVGDNPMRGFGLKVTRHEYDETTIRRSDVIVLNSKLQSQMDEQVMWLAHKKGLINFDGIYEVSDLVTGKFHGRSQDNQITLYHNNCGMGLQWPGPATTVYERAKAKGLGRELLHEWFTTSIEKWLELGYHPST